MYSGQLYLNRPRQVLGINQFKMICIQRHIYKSYRISEKGGGGRISGKFFPYMQHTGYATNWTSRRVFLLLCGG